MKKGFTLIELLVVVLIIGILSAVALPQYTVAVEKARVTEALTNLKHAQQALVMEYLAGNAGSSVKAKDVMALSGGVWDKSYGVSYCTKNFFYDFNDYLQVDGYRCTPNNICTACQSTVEYSITLLTPYDGDGWQTEKVCTAHTDLGYKICKSLEGQGFTPYDIR